VFAGATRAGRDLVAAWSRRPFGRSGCGRAVPEKGSTARSQPSGEANGPAQRQEEGDETGGRQREDEREADVQRGRAVRSGDEDEEDERREREREAGGEPPRGVAADAERGDEGGSAALGVADAVDWWGRLAAVRSLAGHTRD